MEGIIQKNIAQIRECIGAAALRSNRLASDVRLMAVTKTVDDHRIQEATQAGIDILGENYVQEARRKIDMMGRPAQWHLIGHLQTNKVKYVVKIFDMIHTIDRVELAEALNKRCAQDGRIMKILVEVNVSGEAAKQGVHPDRVLPLMHQLSHFEFLSVQGLMTMAPWFDDPENARPYFSALRSLRDRIREVDIPHIAMTELSMGMSGDFEVAVEEGATIVRIGQAIFGERPSLAKV